MTDQPKRSCKCQGFFKDINCTIDHDESERKSAFLNVESTRTVAIMKSDQSMHDFLSFVFEGVLSNAQLKLERPFSAKTGVYILKVKVDIDLEEKDE